MNSFPRVGIRESYQWLADIGFDAEKIRRYVVDHSGTLLSVSWPAGISIRLVDVSRFAYFLQKWSAVCNDGKIFGIRILYDKCF